MAGATKPVEATERPDHFQAVSAGFRVVVHMNSTDDKSYTSVHDLVGWVLMRDVDNSLFWAPAICSGEGYPEPVLVDHKWTLGVSVKRIEHYSEAEYVPEP